MAFLIDTDIIINSIMGNASVNRKISEYASIPKALSIVTYGELLYGAKKSSRRERNTSVVYRLAEIFPIMGITRAIMETFTDLKVALDRKGQKIDDFDLLIAATALTLNHTLVTNNTKHYHRIEGLRLENWMR